MNRKLVLELSFNFLTLLSFIGLDCAARVLIDSSGAEVLDCGSEKENTSIASLRIS
jgi:hypothetical protein